MPNAQAVSGGNWVQTAPPKDCYNDGKELSAALQAKCVTSLNNQIKDKKLTKLTVGTGQNVLLHLDKGAADNGWSALAVGNADLVTNSKKQGAGPFPASKIFTSPSTGTESSAAIIRIIEGTSDSKGNQKVYGVWQFELDKADS
ncbi:hypothetical protein ACFQZC_16705 [Streptacidiphilus monticola]